MGTNVVVSLSLFLWNNTNIVRMYDILTSCVEVFKSIPLCYNRTQIERNDILSDCNGYLEQVELFLWHVFVVLGPPQRYDV